MKQALHTLAATLALSTVGLAHGQTATLTYNDQSGTLTLDGSALSQGITGYALELGPGSGLSFETSAFTSALDDGLIPDEVSGSALGEVVNLGSPGLTGSASIGPVLPAGLTFDQLESALIERTYASGLGGGGELGLAVVPEPGAGALLLAGAGLLLRRRRQPV